MVEKLKFAARLNEICDDMGIPPKGKNRQAVLGKRFQVSQESARKWLAGESFPKTIRAAEIASWAGVSFDWLLTGAGPKRLSEHIGKAVNELNKLMEPLDEATQYRVVRIVRAILNEGPDKK